MQGDRGWYQRSHRHRGRDVCRLAIVVLALAAVFASVAVGSVAASTNTTTSESAQHLNVTATVTQAEVPGHFRVDLDFTGSNTTTLVFEELPTMEPIETRGYTRDGEYWVWRGNGTPPAFSYTLDEEADRYHHVTETWAVGDVRDVLPEFVASGSETRHVTVPQGWANDEVLLLGEYTTANASGADGPLTAVVSNATRETVTANQSVQTLADVTRALNVSTERQNTKMVIVPDTYSGPFGFGLNDTFLIRGDAVWDGLMTHEYLHTRQAFETGPEMRWFVEGSAFYYMALIPHYRGTMEWDEFSRRTSPFEPFEPVVLTENQTYTAAQARGPPVLAALDRRIRVATHNERTLEDVYRRLNRQERLTYERFRETVTDVAGPALADWLDRYVDGTATPDPVERGQFVPSGWEPAPDRHLWVCEDGHWATVDAADHVVAGEQFDVAYTGFGDLTVSDEVTFHDERAGVCDREALRAVGEAAPRLYSVSASSSFSVTVDQYYDAEAVSATVPVEERASSATGTTPAESGDTETADATATPAGDGTATGTARTATANGTTTPGASGPGFGVVGVLVALACTVGLRVRSVA